MFPSYYILEESSRMHVGIQKYTAKTEGKIHNIWYLISIPSKKQNSTTQNGEKKQNTQK